MGTNRGTTIKTISKKSKNIPRPNTIKLTTNKKGKKTITPLVKSLSGVIRLPKDYNEKQEYTDYLTNKYK